MTLLGSHAVSGRDERGKSVDFAGTCMVFARNVILFLFERKYEGYKCRADCTVGGLCPCTIVSII